MTSTVVVVAEPRQGSPYTPEQWYLIPLTWRIALRSAFETSMNPDVVIYPDYTVQLMLIAGTTSIINHNRTSPASYQSHLR